MDYCRDYGPCGVGEGDCDGSGQCESGLQCSQDVGATYGFPADYDVCEAASGGGPNGHVDYCRDYGPCGVGEGDCDGSGQCESGLQCSQDVGATYGFPADYDVCEAASGGGPNGHVDYCRDSGPCGVGEGDCDGSSQCESGLQCSQDVGATYGFPGRLRCVRSRLRGRAERARGLLSGLWAVQCGRRRRLRWEQSVPERAAMQSGCGGQLRVPGRLRCVRSPRKWRNERARGLLSGLWAVWGRRRRLRWEQSVPERAAMQSGCGGQLRVPGPTTMCAKPPQVRGRTGTWTTVGTLGRVGWAKATAIVPANVRAGSSAAGMWGQATGSRRPTMCAKPPQVRGRTGTWTTVGMRGRVGWAKAIAIAPASVRAGSSAAGMSGQATGSRRTTMCASSAAGRRKGAALGVSQGVSPNGRLLTQGNEGLGRGRKRTGVCYLPVSGICVGDTRCPRRKMGRASGES